MHNKIAIILLFILCVTNGYCEVIINCDSEIDAKVIINTVTFDSILFYQSREIKAGENCIHFDIDKLNSDVLQIEIKDNQYFDSKYYFFTGKDKDCEISFNIIENNDPYYYSKYIVSDVLFNKESSDINNFLYHALHDKVLDLQDNYRNQWEKEYNRLDSLRTSSTKKIKNFENENRLSELQKFVLKDQGLGKIYNGLLNIGFFYSTDSVAIKKLIDNYISDNKMFFNNNTLNWYKYSLGIFSELSFCVQNSDFFEYNGRSSWLFCKDSSHVKKYYQFLKDTFSGNNTLIGNIVNRTYEFPQIDKYIYFLDLFINDLKTGNDSMMCQKIEQQKANYSYLLPGNPVKYDLTLTDTSGTQHKLSDFTDKIIYLDFWSTGCGSCIKAMPKLTLLQDTLTQHNANDVVIINVCVDSRYNERWKELIRKLKPAGFCLLISKEDQTKLKSDFHLTSYPRYVLLDKCLIIKNLRAPHPDGVIDEILDMIK